MIRFAGSDGEDVARAEDFCTRMGYESTVGARIFLGQATDAEPTDTLLCDTNGIPLDHSSAVADAVRINTGRIEVSLVHPEFGILSRGTVGTRRSVNGTIAACRRVAGPLAVMSLTGTAANGQVQAADPVPRSQVLIANMSGAVRFGGRLLRAAGTYREWGCAPISEIGPDTPRLRLRGPWRNGPDRFWADPCVGSADGQTWLFMEELIRSTGRGHIVAAPVVSGDIDTSRVRTVLANDHHLSFPQVQRHEGRWVATVETCAGHNPFYEFDAMGEPWREYDGVTPLPPHTADPVADLACGELIGTDARTDPDSVFVRYILRDGSWEPVLESVFVDVGWARGGGRWDRHRGWRTVQDCAGTYGRAAGLVDAATQTVHLRRWSASDLSEPGRWKGVHTVTWDSPGANVWVDGWRRAISPMGWRHRLKEREHLATCQG